MSSFFAYSLDQYGGDTRTHSFDDGYSAPHFSNFNSTVSGGEFISYPAYFSSETSPILPPPAVMEHRQRFALREWRRQNTIRLEEKEKREKELRSQIIAQADNYKAEFHRKRQARCESIKLVNRKKEQAFVAIQEKFHGEAHKDYWKSIAEMIPKEVPAIEKRKLMREQGKKKASTVVVHGPKPGKPSDLSRMRQILLMLKHNTPPHLKLSPSAPDANTSAAVA